MDLFVKIKRHNSNQPLSSVKAGLKRKEKRDFSYNTSIQGDLQTDEEKTKNEADDAPKVRNPVEWSCVISFSFLRIFFDLHQEGSCAYRGVPNAQRKSFFAEGYSCEIRMTDSGIKISCHLLSPDLGD